MQGEWLRRYFGHQHQEPCAHAEEADRREGPESDVSRRDFVKTGFVASVAAGVVAGQAGQAQAQAPANPMGRNWWPSP
jgi:hypothetical protein